MFSELFRAAKTEKKGSVLFSLLLFFGEALSFFLLFFILFETVRGKIFGAFQPRALLSELSVVFCFYCLFRAVNFRFFLRSAKNEEKLVFKKFFGSVFLEAVLTLIKSALFFFCFLPAAAMLFVAVFCAQRGVPLTAAAVLIAFFAALIYVGAFFCSRLFSSFFLVPYVYLLVPSLDVFGAIGEGVSKADGKTKALFRLKHRFFRHMLLCLFVFPIPFVWALRKRTLALFAYGLI